MTKKITNLLKIPKQNVTLFQDSDANNQITDWIEREIFRFSLNEKVGIEQCCESHVIFRIFRPVSMKIPPKLWISSGWLCATFAGLIGLFWLTVQRWCVSYTVKVWECRYAMAKWSILSISPCTVHTIQPYNNMERHIECGDGISRAPSISTSFCVSLSLARWSVMYVARQMHIRQPFMTCKTKSINSMSSVFESVCHGVRVCTLKYTKNGRTNVCHFRRFIVPRHA